MNNNIARPVRYALLWCALLLVTAEVTRTQPIADPNFDARVARPAFTKTHPKVLFDEAHFNFHTAGARYKPFAALLTNDGYRITPNREKFSKASLEGYDILVIVSALGHASIAAPEAANPAFTEAECDVVRDWVRAGGSLLLVIDHEPTGAAAESLARRFGVQVSKKFTIDFSNYVREEGSGPGRLLFTRDNRLLVNHSITRGRDATERVNRVVVYGGQSLLGPKGSRIFLKLSATARDLTALSELEKVPAGQEEKALSLGVSVAGRAHGIFFKFGQGRVMMTGEAGMFTAQLYGPKKLPFGGLSHPEADNRQLALNIMHWLSRLL
jgi:hypothetical protein